MRKGSRARLLVLAGLGLAILLSLVLNVFAAVGLIRFEAVPQADASILVTWETATEIGTVAFNLYRATTVDGPWTLPISTQPAMGDEASGAIYSYQDTQVKSGIRYYYLLEELAEDGRSQRFGPVSAGIDDPTSTPTATATRWSTSTPTPTATEWPTATRQPTNSVTVRSLFLPMILRQ